MEDFSNLGIITRRSRTNKKVLQKIADVTTNSILSFIVVRLGAASQNLILRNKRSGYSKSEQVNFFSYKCEELGTYFVISERDPLDNRGRLDALRQWKESAKRRWLHHRAPYFT